MEYIILLISLVGIIFGADLLVAGAVSVARRFRVSDFVIGAAIVGIGTSMPELVVSTLGAVKGNADVAIGNVVGSNIFNVLGILGLTAMLFPVKVTKSNRVFEMPMCITVSILLTFLAFNMFDGSQTEISRMDGLVLLAGFGAFMWYSFYRDRRHATPNQECTTQDSTPMWLAIAKVAGGLTLLILSCDFFVDNAISIAQSFGVDDAFISLTLVACGTSLPELAASAAAAYRKNTQMALGNIVGSNIFNITFILGLSSQVMPLTASGVTLVDYVIMTAVAIMPLVMGGNNIISRREGAFMFACFVGYNWYLLHNQIA